jgi:hydroxypyruvate isomerase
MLKFSANLSLLFRELPFLARFDAARRHGFAGVEIQLPYEHSTQALRRAAADAGVSVVLINAPRGPDPSVPGLACRREQARAFHEAIERAAEYAGALQVPCVNVLAGRASAEEHAACVRQLEEHLTLAADLLSPAGARPLLEVINPIDVPGYCVPSFELAREVLGRCDRRVGLQFDVYHAARLGLDPQEAFEATRSLIAHVQFADCPGRHEPGTGSLAFGKIFATIERSAYQGWVGAEYHPLEATAAGLHWLPRVAPGG